MTNHGALLAQQPGGQWFLIAVVVVLALTRLGIVISLGRLVRPWLQSLFAGAPVSLRDLLSMRLRKIPPQEVVRQRIMAVQAGVPLTTAQLESAWLRGANVDRAVLAMIRANETGQEITWEELLTADSSQRLDERNAL